MKENVKEGTTVGDGARAVQAEGGHCRAWRWDRAWGEEEDQTVRGRAWGGARWGPGRGQILQGYREGSLDFTPSETGSHWKVVLLFIEWFYCGVIYMP